MIKLSETFDDFLNYIFGDKFFGVGMSNPFAIAIIITVIMLMIFIIVHPCRNIRATSVIKLIIYSLAFNWLVVVSHDKVLQRMFRDETSNKTGTHLINSVLGTDSNAAILGGSTLDTTDVHMMPANIAEVDTDMLKNNSKEIDNILTGLGANVIDAPKITGGGVNMYKLI